MNSSHLRPKHLTTEFLTTLRSLFKGIIEVHDLVDVDHHGGRIISSISAKTDYVLAGTDMGPEKRKKAEKLGVPIISEEDFRGMVGAG